MTADHGEELGPSQPTWLSWLGWSAAWAWTIIAGGGGIWLLFTVGPWRLTNGWFALASGIAACPPLSSLLNKHVGIAVSQRTLLALAVLIFVAGHIAVWAGL